jgi:hypothetical protein
MVGDWRDAFQTKKKKYHIINFESSNIASDQQSEEWQSKRITTINILFNAKILFPLINPIFIIFENYQLLLLLFFSLNRMLCSPASIALKLCFIHPFNIKHKTLFFCDLLIKQQCTVVCILYSIHTLPNFINSNTL